MALFDNKPIWDEQISSNGTITAIDHYEDGRPIYLTVYVTNGPPRRVVQYYGDDDREVLEVSDLSGKGLFNTRINYTNNPPAMQILMNNSWETAEKKDKDGGRGIVVNGAWIPLKRTNGVWNLLQ